MDEKRLWLVETLRGEDEAAARAAHAELVATYDGYARTVRRKRPLAVSDVEELLQELWTRVWTNRRTIETPNAFEGWLSTTAINLGTSRLRPKKRSAEVLVDEVPVQQGPISEGLDPDRALDLAYAEKVLALVRKLDEMPETERKEYCERLPHPSLRKLAQLTNKEREIILREFVGEQSRKRAAPRFLDSKALKIFRVIFDPSLRGK